MVAKNEALKQNMAQNTGRAKELGDDIAQIVMSMQFQDISRQRLERVIKDLSMLQNRLKELDCQATASTTPSE